MGFRFRKSLRILPGVRLNFSKRGTSLSLGGRGATVNISDRGVRKTIGIPGTGMSYESLDRWSDGSAETSRSAQPGGTPVRATWTILGLIVGTLLGFGGSPGAGVLVVAATVVVDVIRRASTATLRSSEFATESIEPINHDAVRLFTALRDERDALLRQPRSARHAMRLEEIDVELRRLGLGI